MEGGNAPEKLGHSLSSLKLRWEIKNFWIQPMIIKRQILSVLLLGVLLAGCEKPGPVEITPVDPDDVLLVEQIDQTNLQFDGQSVDSTGFPASSLFPFAGYFLVNHVSIDRGQGIRSFAFSAVLLADRNRPVLDCGQQVRGYHGIFIPSLSLNDQPMIILPHVVRRCMDTVQAGFEYLFDLSSSYQPNSRYRWGFRSLIGDSLGIQVNTPDSFTLLRPAGGSVQSRNQGMPIEWTGVGKLHIIVSEVASNGKLLPLFILRPRVNRGQANIPSSVLRRRTLGVYALTFVLANQELMTAPTGMVFTQAASIHTTFFVLQ
jgi:hypothetical protein